jgi:hypothetical protein
MILSASANTSDAEIDFRTPALYSVPAVTIIGVLRRALTFGGKKEFHFY